MTCRSLMAHSFRKALFGFADSSLDALVASGKSTEDLCQLTDEAMETYVDESGFLSEFGKAGEKLSRNNKARAERLFVALMSTILLSTSRRDQFVGNWNSTHDTMYLSYFCCRRITEGLQSGNTASCQVLFVKVRNENCCWNPTLGILAK